MRDECTLADYDVQKEDTLYVVPCLCGCWDQWDGFHLTSLLSSGRSLISSGFITKTIVAVVLSWQI
jgi:hypothetical protein